MDLLDYYKEETERMKRLGYTDEEIRARLAQMSKLQELVVKTLS